MKKSPLFAFAIVAVSAASLGGCGGRSPDVSGVAAALRYCPDPDDCAPPDPPPDPGPRPPRPPATCQDQVTGSVVSSASGPVPQSSAVTLYWSIQLPGGCTDAGNLTLDGVPVSGISSSMVVHPIANHTYVLATGSRAIASVAVSVVLSQLQIHITADTVEQRELFKQAAETPGKTVLLKWDLELDLSAYANSPIDVAAGVTIASEAPSQTGTASFVGVGLPQPYTIARDSRHLGPKVFTTVRPPEFLFLLDGDNITLRGFRIYGADVELTDAQTLGIVINSKVGIELDRMEIAGWGTAAVYIKDPDARIQSFDDVWIHDCFIHHNQQAHGGDGYGVETTDGARAFIEHNVFDFNRHAIMSGGVPFTGYFAYENLVLRGGGFHEWDTLPITWQTQIFDVHGTDNCLGQSLNCGQGGELFLITGNSFQYVAGNAFKLRGTPSDSAQVFDNVFTHDDYCDAIASTVPTGDPLVDVCNGITAPVPGRDILPVGNNRLGHDSFARYGVCDFDGDGYDDLFLPTGRTWWFSSGGKFQWTYLNSQTDDLGTLGLGDFNHDGKCDVLRVNAAQHTWEISSGGTSGWTTLPGTHTSDFSQLRFYDFNGDGYPDVFERGPNGEWTAYYSPDMTPHPMGGSGFDISKLYFGDFDGDHVTDILSVSGGHWAWSRSGTQPWATRNAAFDEDDLDGDVVIGNFDGIPGDDVMYVAQTPPQVGAFPVYTGARFSISSGAAGPWTTLAEIAYPQEVVLNSVAYHSQVFFTGQFVLGGRDSILALDVGKDLLQPNTSPVAARTMSQFTVGQAGFFPYGLYPF